MCKCRSEKCACAPVVFVLIYLLFLSKKHVPSTPWNRLLGGTYMSLQFGQYSFTVSSPGMSDRPHGTTLHPTQYTRGHDPNTPASYLSTCPSTHQYHIHARMFTSHAPSTADPFVLKCTSDGPAHTAFQQTIRQSIRPVF